MRRPSRDQLGTRSSVAPVVNWRGAPPDDGITKIALPGRRASKAISEPSGDQLGVPAGGPPRFVSCLGFAPSRSHTQTSMWPLRDDSNAIRRPSGDSDGLRASL